MWKDQIFKTTGFQFDNWLFGPDKFSRLSRNRLLTSLSLECHALELFMHKFAEARLSEVNEVFQRLTGLHGLKNILRKWQRMFLFSRLLSGIQSMLILCQLRTKPFSPMMILGYGVVLWTFICLHFMSVSNWTRIGVYLNKRTPSENNEFS